MVSSLPPSLADRLRDAFGADELARLLASTSRRGIRVNPFQIGSRALTARLHSLGMDVEPVPFARDEALFVEDPLDRPIGLLWEHQAGHFYGQDPASLLAVHALDPRPGERVLDLCAAPGGKATHIAHRMENRGLVVANDAVPGRLNNLATTLDRLGALNVVVTARDGTRARFPYAFDRVLVDAPCSTLGNLHTSPRAAKGYSPERVRHLVHLQQGLLARAFHATKSGGTVVYSTCTLEPRENEGVASWFLENFAVEAETFDPGVGRPGLVHAGKDEYAPEVENARRIHPGDAGTDGFFVARFRKIEGEPHAGRHLDHPEHEAAPEALDEIGAAYGLEEAFSGHHAIRAGRRVFLSAVPPEDALPLRPHRPGLAVAAYDKRTDDYRLTFDAATHLGRHATRQVEVSPDAARTWMAGEGVPAPGGTPTGWSVLTCQGETVGCTRPFGRKLANFVPKERRVPRDARELVGFLAGP